eukprot:gene5006-5247_t
MKSNNGTHIVVFLLVAAALLAVGAAAAEGSTANGSTAQPANLTSLTGVRRMLRRGWGGGGGRFGPASVRYYGGPSWSRGYMGWGWGSPYMFGPRIPDENRMETSNSRRFARVNG